MVNMPLNKSIAATTIGLTVAFGLVACNTGNLPITPFPQSTTSSVPILGTPTVDPLTSTAALPPVPALPTATRNPPIVAPTATLKSAMFKGHFTAAFEIMLFYPCDMKIRFKEVKGFEYSLGYWLRMTVGTGFGEQYEDLHSQAIMQQGLDKRAPFTVYVRFLGTLSPTISDVGRGYGHMGLYQNEVAVTELLEMKPDAAGQCSQ